MTDKQEIKRQVILNLPFVAIFYLANKLSYLYCILPVYGFMDKLIGVVVYFKEAFSTWWPSLNLNDIAFGIAAAAAMKAILYFKSKNKKNFRIGEEYGSARWGTREDIRP